MNEAFGPDEIAAAAARLEGASPEAILRWAVDNFFPKLTMATAFQPGGNCIIHMLAGIEKRVRVFNLDTGYQFPETLDVRSRLKERYGIEVELVQPDLSVAEYEQGHGGPLYGIRPDQCCHDRKVVPLRRAVVGYRAWISGIRKDQTQERGQTDVVQWDPKFNLVKISPLLNWTRNDVWKFILDNDVPYNALHDQNYPSIGCWPCTNAVGVGDDERAGRWAGKKKKECGLHVIEVQGGSGI